MSLAMVRNDRVAKGTALRSGALHAQFIALAAASLPALCQRWLQRGEGDRARVDAAHVHYLARQARRSNPGLAADLDAAVERFEAQLGKPR